MNPVSACLRTTVLLAVLSAATVSQATTSVSVHAESLLVQYTYDFYEPPYPYTNTSYYPLSDETVADFAILPSEVLAKVSGGGGDVYARVFANGTASVRSDASYWCSCASGTRTSLDTVTASSNASWQDKWYVAPTVEHASGSLGRLHVTLTFSERTRSSYLPDSFDINTSLIGASLLSVNGQGLTVGSQWSNQEGYNRVFEEQHSEVAYFDFQYGVAFDVSLLTWSSASVHGDERGGPWYANGEYSSHISQVLAPLGTTVQSGISSLNVVNSSDPNLNPIPEPSTYALMFAGLGLLGFVARRHKT